MEILIGTDDTIRRKFAGRSLEFRRGLLLSDFLPAFLRHYT